MRTRQYKPHETMDGWCARTVHGGEDCTSFRNYYVQGGAAAIMRRAVIKALRQGLKIVILLHDCIYIEHDAGDLKPEQILGQCMDESVTELLGNGVIIRHDSKHITHEELWVEKRAKTIYEKISPFLTYSNPNVEIVHELSQKIELGSLFEGGLK